jgi:hypothetical protein
MAAKDAKTLSLGVSALPGPLAQLAKEFIGLGAPISQTSRELEAMSGGAFGDAIKQFQNTGDLVAFQNSIKTISGEVMKNSEGFGDAALAGGGFAEALNAVAASIGTAVSDADITGELEAAGDNIAEQLNLTTGRLDKLKAGLEVAVNEGLNGLINEGPRAAAGLKFLADKLEEFDKEGRESVSSILNSIGRFIQGKDVKEPTDVKEKSRFSFFGSSDQNSGAFSYLDGKGIDTSILQNNRTGSDGFQDYGSGTPAMLHGVEAVVPKNDIGQLTKVLAQATGTTTTNTTAGDTVTNNTTTDMTILNNNTTELIHLNKKLAQHLNTLVTIGAMTEKNTKSTNNSLANMGGSLV